MVKKEENNLDQIKQVKFQILDEILDASVEAKEHKTEKSEQADGESVYLLNDALDKARGTKKNKLGNESDLPESESALIVEDQDTSNTVNDVSFKENKSDLDESSEQAAKREALEKKLAETNALIPDYASMSIRDRFEAARRVLFIAPYTPNAVVRRERNDFRLLANLDVSASALQPERDFHDSQKNTNEQRNRGAVQNEREENGSKRKSAEQQEKQQATEPQRVKGSTRIEAKRQRRHESRGAGRYRRGHVTESEFLARREAVDRKMIVRTKADRVQIGVLEDNILVEHYVARSADNSLIGNVYLGRVQNVLPSMEAAFVDIGKGRNAVLYAGEVDRSSYTGSNAGFKIEQVLKPGDNVLVQVTKDPVGQKGARLTGQISLPGRYLVYVPGGATSGTSRKLPDNERSRLKKALKKILPDGAGVIVRTAAEGATEEQLTRDVNHLTRQWERIQREGAEGGAPKTLHSEADVLIKLIRDVFNEDFQELIVDDHHTYKQIAEYLEDLAPDLLERVKLYEGTDDVFGKFRITEQIQKALDRKVYLPSGGSLVIDRTEAMTVIDVNTGKFVGSGGNLEQTVTKNNLEAAEEIVRQLRLRDIGGIIVVDFIDMVLEENRDLVQRRLIDCLRRDRTKHQVAEVTSLGLVQMTRKKLGLGLLETFSEPCESCAGRGVVVFHEPHVGGKADPTKRGKARAQGKQPGTHHLTDGAKNMLAQVAAKTIAPVETADVTVADAQESTDKTIERKSPLKRRSKRRVAKNLLAAEQKNQLSDKNTRISDGVSESVKDIDGKQEKNLDVKDSKKTLDSVLAALPEAPGAGESKQNRRSSRRASRP